MKKKNIKKTILLTLGIISIFSIAAFAASGSTINKGQTISYWNTPHSGYCNAATEISPQQGVYDYRYVGVDLFTRYRISDNSWSKTKVSYNVRKQSAGTSYSASPGAWTSEHQLYENGSALFNYSLWSNAQ